MDRSPAPTRLPFPDERRALYEEASKNASSPLFKRTIPAPKHDGDTPLSETTSKDNAAMSFVMLTESQLVPPQTTPVPNGNLPISSPKSAPDHPESHTSQNLSVKSDQADYLFRILSSRSDIDHPICAECSELLLSSLNKRLQDTTKHRDAYISTLKELQNSAPTPHEIEDAEATLENTREAETAALRELQAVEKEKRDIDAEIAKLELESAALAEEEHAFWASQNEFSTSLREFEEERDALNAAFDADSALLSRLQRTNVYNDTFCISHDGTFVTINGLRLGRLAPPNNVEWSEINAALGFAALLLTVVAEKMGFTFKGWRLRPMGSTSKIEKLSDSSKTPANQQQKTQSLDLFSSGDLPLGRGILHRRLDAGLVALLDCLQQIGDFVTGVKGHRATRMPGSPTPTSPQISSPVRPGVSAQRSTSQRTASKTAALSDQTRVSALPYPINKDTINGVNIRLGASNDEEWSRACKYMLTCCKYLLAEASGWDSHASPR